MTQEVEYKFKDEQQAWDYAEQYGVDYIKEQHTSNDVVFIVVRKRYGF